ncbi:MAG TPA: host attachment protein [Aquabacterium sp.]|nr:host attachment protein [Aquabacterium sp.]
MYTCWLLAANEGRARVFEIHPSDGAWREVEDCISAEAHLPTHLLLRDAKGQLVGGSGGVVHSTSARSDPHDVAAHQFATALVDDLKRAKEAGRFQRLDIVAPPKFLGMLRSELPDALGQVVGRELNKDWSNLDADEIARRYVSTKTH